MDHQTIGFIAGMLVIASAVPYCAAIIRKEEPEVPNMVTWVLWTFIGFAILVTYWGTGARETIWNAVFGFTNPMIVVGLAIWQRRRLSEAAPLTFRPTAAWRSLKLLDRWCFAIGVASLIVWWKFQNEPGLAAYALYLALVADACAALPTIRAHFTEPKAHPPLAWGMFALASFFNLFAVSEPSVPVYVMPVYMLIGSSLLTLPLVIYRIRHRSPFRQWY